MNFVLCIAEEPNFFFAGAEIFNFLSQNCLKSFSKTPKNFQKFLFAKIYQQAKNSHIFVAIF